MVSTKPFNPPHALGMSSWHKLGGRCATSKTSSYSCLCFQKSSQAITHRILCIVYIYLPWIHNNQLNVGKYTVRPMDPKGNLNCTDDVYYHRDVSEVWRVLVAEKPQGKTLRETTQIDAMPMFEKTTQLTNKDRHNPIIPPSNSMENKHFWGLIMSLLTTDFYLDALKTPGTNKSCYIQVQPLTIQFENSTVWLDWKLFQSNPPSLKETQGFIPKYLDPAKLAVLRTWTPAKQVQTLPLEGPIIPRNGSFFWYSKGREHDRVQ